MKFVRSTTISVVELQGVSQGNSDSGSEQLRLPTASLTIVFYNLVQNVVQTCLFVSTIEYNQPTQNSILGERQKKILLLQKNIIVL